MEILKNTLAVVWDIWHDPGDYPNGLARGPLQSYEYPVGVTGCLKVRLSAEKLAERAGASSVQELRQDHAEELKDAAEDGDFLDDQLPQGGIESQMGLHGFRRWPLDTHSE